MLCTRRQQVDAHHQRGLAHRRVSFLSAKTARTACGFLSQSTTLLSGPVGPTPHVLRDCWRDSWRAQAGQYEQAIDEYTQAIAADPSHFKSFFNRVFSHDKVRSGRRERPAARRAFGGARRRRRARRGCARAPRGGGKGREARSREAREEGRLEGARRAPGARGARVAPLHLPRSWVTGFAGQEGEPARMQDQRVCVCVVWLCPAAGSVRRGRGRLHARPGAGAGQQLRALQPGHHARPPGRLPRRHPGARQGRTWSPRYAPVLCCTALLARGWFGAGRAPAPGTGRGCAVWCVAAVEERGGRERGGGGADWDRCVCVWRLRRTLAGRLSWIRRRPTFTTTGATRTARR